VGPHVIHHDHITRWERRTEDVLHKGATYVSIGSAVDRHQRCESWRSSGASQRHIRAIIARHAAHSPGARRGPALEACQRDIDARFIDTLQPKVAPPGGPLGEARGTGGLESGWGEAFKALQEVEKFLALPGLFLLLSWRVLSAGLLSRVSMASAGRISSTRSLLLRYSNTGYGVFIRLMSKTLKASRSLRSLSHQLLKEFYTPRSRSFD
jgi:hypothetical protein